MEHDEHSTVMTSKYLKTIRHYLKEEDIGKALNALRALMEEAESRKGLQRPMIQLQAAKAMIEYHAKVAELEIKENRKPDAHVTNIYNTIPKDSTEDDALSISRRLNLGLSDSVKR